MNFDLHITYMFSLQLTDEKSQKYSLKTFSWGCNSVIEHFPDGHEALGSILSTWGLRMEAHTCNPN